MIGIFTNLNYGVSEELDTVLREALNTLKLEKAEYGEYYVTLHFEGGVSIKAWDENRYFAWLVRGSVEKDGETILRWDGVRPRRRTMNRLLKLLKRHVLERIKVQR